MPVPESIRAVPRPRNTVVVDSGHEGARRYAVRERSGVKYGPGGRSRPINGRVIGHICNDVFVPVGTIAPTASKGPDELSYGAAAFVYSETTDLLHDLLAVYPPEDAYAILCVAMIRTMKPEVKIRRLSTEYRRTFVSRFYAGVHLSINHTCRLLELVGEDGEKRSAFYERRLQGVAADHHIVIDGMLKQDTSTVNDFSAFSYKGRIKGCRDISVLYAYDLEKMEPVCAEVFAGNHIDAVSFATFLRDRKIERGLIVTDKGFPPGKIQGELAKHPDLHYLIPIKRNDARIRKHDMLSFEGVLKGIDEQVSYCKKQVRGGRWLYAFKDYSKASGERFKFIENMKKDARITQADFEKKASLFGVIVFESDQDLDPLTAYLCYEDRWQIELVFDMYKNDECLDHTNVQDDFSVQGNEFVNFIATILTCRLRRRAQRAGLLNQSSFKDLMEDLGTAWRKAESPAGIPTSGDEYWVTDYPGVFGLLEALELSKAQPDSKTKPVVTVQGLVVPRKRGRPRVRPIIYGPPRPRGRPRKIQ